jgi:hypothetical protein
MIDEITALAAKNEAERLAAAEDPRTATDVLAWLTLDDAAPIRAAAAQNPGCPPAIRQKLLEDKAAVVRYAAQVGMLDHMSRIANEFYAKAVTVGVHSFIEFTGLLHEYTTICRNTLEHGADFQQANTHSGMPLKLAEHHIAYTIEKLECIYGPTLEADPAFREAWCALAKPQPQVSEPARCSGCDLPNGHHRLSCSVGGAYTKAYVTKIDDKFVLDNVTSEKPDDPIIPAGSRLPFVQTGMIVHADDCLHGNGITCAAIVSALYEESDGMTATLEYPGGRRRIESCQELRRRYKLTRDFDPNRTYTGRFAPPPKGEVRLSAEIEPDA